MRVAGHYFRKYGEEELLCPVCGFVIWSCKTQSEVLDALLTLGGGTCPGTYHGKHGPLDPDEERASWELTTG